MIRQASPSIEQFLEIQLYLSSASRELRGPSAISSITLYAINLSNTETPKNEGADINRCQGSGRLTYSVKAFTFAKYESHALIQHYILRWLAHLLKIQHY